MYYIVSIKHAFRSNRAMYAPKCGEVRQSAKDPRYNKIYKIGRSQLPTFKTGKVARQQKSPQCKTTKYMPAYNRGDPTMDMTHEEQPTYDVFYKQKTFSLDDEQDIVDYGVTQQIPGTYLSQDFLSDLQVKDGYVQDVSAVSHLAQQYYKKDKCGQDLDYISYQVDEYQNPLQQVDY